MNITMTHEFEVIECANCGCLFAITKDLKSNLRETKNAFYCPNGHAQSYRKSTTEILREKLAEVENQRDIKQQRIADLSRTIDELKRPKRRAKRITSPHPQS